MEAINTKEKFIVLYQRGTLGNRSPTWPSIDAMQEDFENSYPLLNNANQLWHIRNRVAGGPTYYDIPGEVLADKWAEVGGDQFYISAMAPTERTLFQGEVRQSEQGLDLYYSTVAKPMRASLLEGGTTTQGIMAAELLRKYMDATSHDWLQHLLETYQDHVVEFSCYGVPWGTLGWNTIFWEVRAY